MAASLLVFLIGFFTTVNIDQQLEDAGIAFSLPNNAWRLSDRNEGRGMVVYTYKREPVEDGYGRKVVANVSIMVERVSEGLDVHRFSSKLKARAPFSIHETISLSNSLHVNNALGYKGDFTDSNGLRHLLYVVHIRNKDKGVQLVLDVPETVQGNIEPEFQIILNSLRLI